MDDKLATGQELNNGKTTNTTRPQEFLLNVQSRSFVRPCRHYKDDYGNVECHFAIQWRFEYVMNLMSNVDNDGLFADNVDTPKRSTEVHTKQECSNSAISKRKVYLPGGKSMSIWQVW